MPGEILEQLSEDLRTNEAFAGMNTASDIAKAFLDSKGKASEFEGKVKSFEGEITNLKENSIPKLPPNASPEEREMFYLALGRPEKPEGYAFTPQEGIFHDESMVSFARNAFFKANLTKEQAESITQDWDNLIEGMSNAQAEAAKVAKDKAESELKNELGAKYDEATTLVKRLVPKYLGDSYKEYLEQTKTEDGVALGNNPVLIKMLYQFAKVTGEDTTPPGTSTMKTNKGDGMVYSKSPKPPNNT